MKCSYYNYRGNAVTLRSSVVKEKRKILFRLSGTTEVTTL